MEIKGVSADRNLTLQFSGELDHPGTQRALQEMERAIDTALPRKLVLDFAGVTFMDSSGIALLLRARRQMERLNGIVILCNVPPQARRVLDAAGIARLVATR